MTDVSHELGALRFVVDSPLSSKVAMFNNQATQHKQSQLLNPFSHDGRAPSPKPTFSKDQYGKPLAGSLTEMRGQKANMHVMKEMLELCQIIDSEGYEVKDEPTMRVIPFGELFNIYNYISDKVVGILLRARKHKLLDFEGEMLYQRRDDDVPIFLLRPIAEIRRELNAKVEEIKRGASPAPQSTSVLLDKSAHEQNLKVLEEKRRSSKSRTPSPAVKSKSKSKSPSPAAADKTEVVPAEAAAAAAALPAAAPVAVAAAAAAAPVAVVKAAAAAALPAAVPVAVAAAVAPSAMPVEATVPTVVIDQPPTVEAAAKKEVTPAATIVEQTQPASSSQADAVPSEAASTIAPAAAAPANAVPAEAAPAPVAPSAAATESLNELPTIVIEASATFVRTVSVEPVSEQVSGQASEQVVTAENA
ncbi:transcriptional regulatory protein AlgP [Drosophila mojavensis]|uniref:transcriptional regulatory protein AlgP n=1 Tax=Drosophila mojavensis TaxID=7230 RepID=UPI0013EED20A|nr:transcriptional regulatory protein AlgP [Drosophila mojavensis]XP_032588768.1 transcriptional regulatory protein AlgP [Drosophila mojavensis]